MDEIEEFVTGTRGSHSGDRYLATLLFTDIVASTALSSAMGDERWWELLDRHDLSVRRQLGRIRRNLRRARSRSRLRRRDS